MADPRTASIRIEARGERWEHVRVHRLAGREAVGQLFSFDLDVACDTGHDLPDGAVPGEEVSVVFELDGEEVRRVHGILGPIRAHLAGAAEHRAYGLRVVPRAARLAFVQTQEIYLDVSVPDIVRSKLERHGFEAVDFDLRLMGTYAAREFVAQFKETDLAFVSRLAEHAGISFFFEHDDGRDRMVFTDHPDGFRATSPAQVPFQGRGETSGVFDLDRVSDLAPTSHIVQDYNYRAPRVDLSACSDLPSGNGGGVVEYGCNVKTPAEAEQIALVRAEEQRSRQTVYEGKSGVMALSAGRRATLVDVPGLPEPEPLLLAEVTHDATFPLFTEGGAGGVRGAEARYHNTFRGVPGGFTYRPPRVTPRPVIAGPVTGVVQPGGEGETGGVAQIDAEGRYLIQFHFDTAQPGEEKASHRVRMAQPFAGPGYGMHMPLRRGTEVLLAFTNGDPDRPVIVGALYNATSPSPVVASNANRHQIRASSGATFEFGSDS